MNLTIKKEQQTIKLLRDMQETIKCAKEIRSGHLYAVFMGIVSLEEYNQILSFFKNTGLIEITPSLLIRWIKKEVSASDASRELAMVK